MVAKSLYSSMVLDKKFSHLPHGSAKNLKMTEIRFNKCIKVSLAIILILVLAGAALFFLSRSSLQKVGEQVAGNVKSHFFSESTIASNGLPTCEITPDSQKFDCFPRGTPDEKSCTERGCCWIPKTTDAKIPWCYYPAGYKSYKVVSKTPTKCGQNLKLNLTSKSIYPLDVEVLSVQIVFETETRLHVKILDANNSRFEPPYPEVPVFNTCPQYIDYEIVVNDDPFGFAVVRKNTGIIIFDTRNVGGFTYSDQFLQLSALIPSNYIYGLGEQRNNFVLSTDWQQITLFNHDIPPTNNKNLYGSHPFYLSLEENGISHGVFLLNSNAMDIVLQPAPAITYRTIGGILDFYFFLGPSPANVVTQYTEVIGKPFLPPYWSLGFHLCRFGLRTLNETEAFWSRNYEAGIPFDVQWNDIDYMNKRNDFTINPTFEGLSSFVDHLHELGMKYIVILDPGVAAREPRGTYPPYDIGFESNIFIKNSTNLPLEGKVWNYDGATVFPDFTNPNSIIYWMEMLTNLYKQFKYDGLWLDMNEISNFVQGSLTGCSSNKYDNPPYIPNVDGGSLNFKTLCMSGMHYAGLHYNVHNIYGFSESMVTSFCLATIRMKRPFLLSRSTFPGSGHFGAHWTGDVYSTWDDMKHSVGDIINFGMFGIPMVGADICGFNGNTTRELCQRWSQLGAFYPFSRNHNTDDAIDQDPAAIGIVESTKKVLKFRYHLLPYLYTLMWNAFKSGESVIRPMFFEFPEDPQTYTDNRKFLWGPAFLVIPVLEEGQITVTTYFPKGIWFDAYTLDWYYSNGDIITLNASLDYIPLYFRAGFIVPYQEPAQTTVESRKNPFGLYVPIDENGQAFGSLHWDDGESYNTFDENQYNMLEFEFTDLSLSGLATNWGYQTPMILNTIKIMGLNDIVKSVSVNNETHTNFEYYPDDKKLIINSANIDMSQSFFVQFL